MNQPLLSVKNLTIDYIGEEKDFRAVDNVSFDVAPGEVFGLAGESGCGKSTIAFAISRLHKPPALIRKDSQILLADRDVLDLDPEALAGQYIELFHRVLGDRRPQPQRNQERLTSE